MSYKITRASDAYEYTAPGHFNVQCTRLVDAGDVGGKLILGVSHFEVGGGTEFKASALESIYYILKGQMTVKTENEEITLHAGDVIHCGGGTPKSVLNTGDCVCDMLVCLVGT